MIEVQSSGLVYRNPKPFLRSVHAWHPSVVRVGSELVTSFDLGEAVESLNYATYLSRSGDGGRTWEPPRRLLEDAPGRPSTHTVRLGQLANGTLLGFGGRFWRDDCEEGLTHRGHLGFVPMELLLVESSDGGRTWEAPRTLRPRVAGPAFEICHRIVEARDGRLLAPTSTWRGWDEDAPGGMRAIALVSRDRGRTWSHHLEVFDAHDEGIVYWEVSLEQLPDGRLLAVAWAFDAARRRTLPTPFTLAADGVHFSPPRPTGFRAQTAKLLVLGDGRVLCVYRRDDEEGLWANLARLQGDDWVTLAQVPLWRGAPAATGGATSAADQLAGLRFGYPSLVELAGGEVFVVFWCLEELVHNIRWLRLQVSGK